MNWLLAKVVGNPLLLLWIALGAFAAGAVSGGGAAWTVQGWRLEVLQTKHDALVEKVKLLGEQAEKDRIATEKAHTKITQEIKDAIPKKIAAARSAAVAAYRLRYPDTGGSDMSCPANSPGGTDAAGEEPVVAGCAEEFVKDSAEDAATIGQWQALARGIGFPVK